MSNIADDALGTKEGAFRSKDKGNRNELRAAKWFSEWTGASFNRTPASGGLRWVEASRISGDIVAPVDFDFPFTVEVKSRKRIHLPKKVPLPAVSYVHTLFSEAYTDSMRAGKVPVLFMRANGWPANEWLMAVETKVYKAMCRAAGAPYSVKVVHRGSPKRYEHSELTLVNSAEVLANVPYERFAQEVKASACRFLKSNAV